MLNLTISELRAIPKGKNMGGYQNMSKISIRRPID